MTSVARPATTRADGTHRRLLSRDHHHGLVVAQRLNRATETTAPPHRDAQMARTEQSAGWAVRGRSAVRQERARGRIKPD